MGGGSNTSAVSKTFNMASLGVDETTITNIQAICNQQLSADNIVQIVGSTVKNLNTSQLNSAQNFCQMQAFLNNTQDSSLKNNVLTALSTDLKADADILGGGSSSDTDTTTINQTFANLSQTQINNVLQKCIQQQSVENIIQIIGSNSTNQTSNQVNATFLNCVNGTNQSSSQTAEAAVENNTKVQDKGQSTSGVDIMSSFASISAYFTAIAVVCGLIIIGSIISSITSSAMPGGKTISASSASPGAPLNINLTQGTSPEILSPPPYTP